MSALDMDPVVALPFDLIGAQPAAIARAIGLMGDHALCEESLERLGHPKLAKVLKRARPEACVEQVEDRMLDPADILGDGKPGLGFRAIERLVLRLAGETDEIPAGIDEGVERVRLALRRTAAARAFDLLPRRMPIQRIARDIESHVL